MVGAAIAIEGAGLESVDQLEKMSLQASTFGIKATTTVLVDAGAEMEISAQQVDISAAQGIQLTTGWNRQVTEQVLEVHIDLWLIGASVR